VVATARNVHGTLREIARFDGNLYSVRLENRGPDVYAVPVGLNSAPAVMGRGDDSDISQIVSNKEISDTEKQQLIQARRGQGLFRARVELIESGCRVTRVMDRAYLRTGHIKPWREATNAERLDGNNGLLLAPHIDHLFYRGFISSENDGQLLVSPRLNMTVLKEWGIQSSKDCGSFNPHQCAYLAFHRTRVFLSA